LYLNCLNGIKQSKETTDLMLKNKNKSGFVRLVDFGTAPTKSRSSQGSMLKFTTGFTLIEILIVIGIIAIIATVVLVAINPARQFAQARNTQRISNVNAILNAIGQFVADNQGRYPTSVASTTPATKISNDGGGIDLCGDMVPIYLPSLPTDPGQEPHNGAPITDCSVSYDSGYEISRDTAGRITISAPLTETSSTTPNIISVTR
jgi:prepilin-type N-terminal cleavage/methylation domain-containing protein